MGAVTECQTRDIEAFLLGRATYDVFAGFWPTLKNNEFGVADKWNQAPKYVVSTTLQKADWNNTTLIGSDVNAEIRALKQQPGGTIGVVGSATLVHSLLAAGLIDEVHVLVHPLVRGQGVRLFEDGYRSSLTLIESKGFANGIVYAAYQVRHDA